MNVHEAIKREMSGVVYDRAQKKKKRDWPNRMKHGVGQYSTKNCLTRKIELKQGGAIP
jgi:hypothetical protein